MQRFEVLEVSEQDRWLELLEQVKQYNCYHLPSYHRLSEISGEGRGVLLSYTSDELVVLFPLLICNIDDIPGLESVGQGWFDAVSVYGYAGPIASRELNKEEKTQFWGHLKEYFYDARLVSIFTSLHPLLGQEYILDGFGDIIPTNPTVAIDLTLPPDIQWNNYRKSHRNEINQLREKGFVCFEDCDKKYWNKFVSLYYETMHRLNADSYYYFPREYFRYLKDNMRNEVKLFVCLYLDELVNAGTATYCNGIIQAHLGGVDGKYVGMGTGKLLEDTIRLWGNEVGAHAFHLGRGLGGAKDSLFHYKKGFSNKETPFYFWKLINHKAIYQLLLNEQCMLTDIDIENNYFPAYRNPKFNFLRTTTQEE